MCVWWGAWCLSILWGLEVEADVEVVDSDEPPMFVSAYPHLSSIPELGSCTFGIFVLVASQTNGTSGAATRHCAPLKKCLVTSSSFSPGTRLVMAASRAGILV